MIVQMGYGNTGEAGQDLLQKRACQGAENAAEIQGQGPAFGKNDKTYKITGPPVQINRWPFGIAPTNVQSSDWVFIDAIQ